MSTRRLKKKLVERGLMDVNDDFFTYHELNLYEAMNEEVLLLHPSVLEIPNDAFEDCQNVKHVEFENEYDVDDDHPMMKSQLERIGNFAFFRTSIVEIRLPGSLRGIGMRAFHECDRLLHVDLEGCERLEKIGKHAFESCASIRTVRLPTKSLREIGQSAFYDCRQLREVVNLERCSELEIIGDRAFSLTSIETLRFPPSLKTICKNAFRSCEELKRIDFGVTMPEGEKQQDNPCQLKSIGKGAFSRNTSLQTVRFPSSLQAIEDNAFEYCERLKTIDFEPSGQCSLERIGREAFVYGRSIQTIRFPESLKVIGGSAFSKCERLRTIHFDQERCAALERIGTSAFEGTSIEAIRFPSSTRIIEDRAFEFCERLLNAEFGEDCVLERIGDDAFHGCARMEEIRFPASLRAIGARAFQRCEQLKSVWFVEMGMLERIDAYAFSYTSLQTIRLPPSLTDIGINAFG